MLTPLTPLTPEEEQAAIELAKHLVFPGTGTIAREDQFRAVMELSRALLSLKGKLEEALTAWSVADSKYQSLDIANDSLITEATVLQGELTEARASLKEHDTEQWCFNAEHSTLRSERDDARRQLEIARKAIDYAPCDLKCDSSIACRNFFPHPGDDDFCGRCMRHRNMHLHRAACNCWKSRALAQIAEPAPQTEGK